MIDYNKIYPNNKHLEFNRIDKELKEFDDTEEAKEIDRRMYEKKRTMATNSN